MTKSTENLLMIGGALAAFYFLVQKSSAAPTSLPATPVPGVNADMGGTDFGVTGSWDS